MGFAGLTLKKSCQYLALLVVLAGLWACHPQTGPVPAKPATVLSDSPPRTPSALPVLPPSEPNPPHPTTLATAMPTPIPAPTACPLIRADDPPRLDYPQDVAVSGDGQTLYITSRPCSDLTYNSQIIQLDTQNSQDCIHRLYILKDSKLSTFPGQLMQTQGCYMSEIELAREENRLYISQLSSSKLLGFDTNTYQPNLDKSVAQFDVDSTTIPLPKHGPNQPQASTQKVPSAFKKTQERLRVGLEWAMSFDSAQDTTSTSLKTQMVFQTHPERSRRERPECPTPRPKHSHPHFFSHL